MITQEKESGIDSIPTTRVAGFEPVTSEFQSQVKAPPDEYIKNCYQATLNLVSTNKALQSIFLEVLATRPMTPQHFVNLYFRALQDIELNLKQNPNYPNDLTNTDKWEGEIEELLKTHHNKLLDTMLHKSTQTTIYQRYAGPKFIISSLFHNQPVTISDWGCGGNYGLPGLTQNEEFTPIVDLTPGKKVSSVLESPLKIEYGLAIDQEDPKAIGAREWLHACSFYPSELDKLEAVLEFEKRISKVQNISFWKQDLAALTPQFLNGHIKPETFDAVIVSTVLYQDPSAQYQAMENAKSILKQRGIVIIQDFAAIDESDNSRLDFNRGWHIKGNYRTFVTGASMDWKMKEVLKWDRARCNEVEPGLDFDIFERG